MRHPDDAPVGDTTYGGEPSQDYNNSHSQMMLMQGRIAPDSSQVRHPLEHRSRENNPTSYDRVEIGISPPLPGTSDKHSQKQRTDTQMKQSPRKYQIDSATQSPFIKQAQQPNPSFTRKYAQYDQRSGQGQRSSSPQPLAHQSSVRHTGKPAEEPHRWVFYGQDGTTSAVEKNQAPLRQIRAAATNEMGPGGVDLGMMNKGVKSRRTQKKGGQTVQNKMKMYQYHWKIEKPVVNAFPALAPHPGAGSDNSSSLPKVTLSPRTASRIRSGKGSENKETLDIGRPAQDPSRLRVSPYSRPASQPMTIQHKQGESVGGGRVGSGQISESIPEHGNRHEFQQEYELQSGSLRNVSSNRLGVSAPERNYQPHLQSMYNRSHTSSPEDLKVATSVQQRERLSGYSSAGGQDSGVGTESQMTPMQMLLRSVDMQLKFEGGLPSSPRANSDAGSGGGGGESSRSSFNAIDDRDDHETAMEVQSAVRRSRANTDTPTLSGVVKRGGRRTPTIQNRHRRVQPRRIPTPALNLRPTQGQGHHEKKSSGSETDSL